MTEDTRDAELLEIEDEMRDLCVDYNSASEAQLGRVLKTGELLHRAKNNVQLRGKGAFNKWVIEKVGMRKSWRSLCMVLFRDRAILPTARAWAKEKEIPFSTVSDIYKLLPRWKKRDQTSSAFVKARQKPSLNLTQAQLEEIVAEHAIHIDPKRSREEKDQAELLLFRLAASRRVLIDRLLKKAGVEVLDSWFSATVEGAPVGSHNNDSKASNTASNNDVSGSSAVGDGSKSPVPTVSPESSPEAFKGGTTAGDGRTSFPAMNDITTKRRVGPKRCREGFELMLRLDKDGIDASSISVRLKQIDLEVSPEKVKRILSKERTREE